MPDDQGGKPAPATPDEVRALLSIVFREEAGRLTASLVRLLGDFVCLKS